MSSSCSSSSSDNEEEDLWEKFLGEASLAVQGAANACSCGEHPAMVAVFTALEDGSVTVAAARIVAALDRCKCGKGRGWLADALDVLVQLGAQLGETREVREQMLHVQRVAVLRARAREDRAQPSDVPSSAPSPQPSDVPSSQPSPQPSTCG